MVTKESTDVRYLTTVDFNCSLDLRGPLTAMQRSDLAGAAEQCPVRKTLQQTMDFHPKQYGTSDRG